MELDNKEVFSNLQIKGTQLFVMIRFFFYGLLGGEFFFFLKALHEQTLHVIKVSNTNVDPGIFVLIIPLLLIYFFQRAWKDCYKVIRSYRFDIFAIFLVGFFAIHQRGEGFLADIYSALVDKLGVLDLKLIVLCPILFYVFVLLKGLIKKKIKPDGYFLQEEEISDILKDSLGYENKVNDFAEQVYNKGSLNSIVFGLNGPWGVGKSSFLKLCQNWWNEHCASKPIVYKFNPLQHNIKDDLLNIFVNGLVSSIQKDVFIPEIRPLISRYSRLIREMKPFNIFGWDITGFENNYLLDDAFDDLSHVLERTDKKIIIIVDDLDRLEISEIKSILYLLRKCFSLPNITYILCYDLENISLVESLNGSHEKLSEFLEKFVNIRVSIYSNKIDLAQYVKSEIENNSLVSRDGGKIEQILQSVIEIYESQDYFNYVNFLGNIRKLKCLINTILFLKLDKADYSKLDIHDRDLVHLLLLYISYPGIFRDIYNAETQGSKEVFSILYQLKDFSDSQSTSGYVNSPYYLNYLEKCPSGGRFLLSKIFSVERLSKNSEELQKQLTSLACFNGTHGSGTNLEEYLDLIVNQRMPNLAIQNKTYENAKNTIIQGQKTIAEVFSEDFFQFKSQGLYSRSELWRLLSLGARGVTTTIGDSILDYTVKTIPYNSYIPLYYYARKYRSRMEQINYLTDLLNSIGWIDESGDRRQNTIPNVLPIAHRIYGEHGYSGKGIINQLSKEENGILGLLDVGHFRYSCSSGRVEHFNISRALGEHYKAGAPFDGNGLLVAREQLREISQYIFNIFNTRYIQTRKNIFTDFKNLSEQELAGKFFDSLVDLPYENREKYIEYNKDWLLTIFIDHFGARKAEGEDIPCGYYDPTGEADQGGIYDIMSTYLFDVCFNPTRPENLKYFIDHIFYNLIQVSTPWDSDDGEKKSAEFISKDIGNIGDLDSAQLATYWQTNRDAIKRLGLENNENYKSFDGINLYYKDIIPKIIVCLDKRIVPTQTITTGT
ncbi:hypothetical protein KA057_00870 [Candidatus Gracilibacteria bacterium]|nr:hypothetical protein [Candidatus Gracilibacteria bacterium]